ncbi:hypothetical protein BDU57DRAFT_518857 [Ampelomyces quisqualis]|uniref:Uncharacterized protein n=1 Tax=Ampelomyces quisqualis TaxID=50730 RepID=A0A6A5QMM3_AMPQU|nr:hypothetical protein BDU57DRAFT_518857 [Ampelomyces quisqualis]
MYIFVKATRFPAIWQIAAACIRYKSEAYQNRDFNTELPRESSASGVKWRNLGSAASEEFASGSSRYMAR